MLPFAVLLLVLAGAVPPAWAEEGGETALVDPTAAPHDPLHSRYRQAVRWLDAGQPEHARTLLAELVTDYPDFAGAWLDLALATYQAGDAVAASEYLEIIRQRFPLTPAMARQLALWQETWRRPPAVSGTPPTRRGWQGEISLESGYSNNVNGGLSQDSVTLTLPGGSAYLPLAAESRPQADSFVQLSTQAWQRVHLANGTMHPIVRLRWRSHRQASDYDQLDAQGGLLYSSLPSAEGSAWQGSLMVQHLRQGGGVLINSQRLAVHRVLTVGGCRFSGGGEYERRSTPGLPLASQLLWLESGFSCTVADSGQLAATLRGGKEYARYADRPGGDNRQLELALHGSWLLAPRTRLEAHWSYSRLHDSAGYSPLLEAGARRRQQRRHGQLSVRHALDAYWEASASIDWQRQESNLAIFRQQARQFTLGVLRVF